MRAPLLVVIALGGCIDVIDARWTLDHDHVIAARATPPRVREGEGTNVDALVAHAGRAPTVENPMTAELSNPPQQLARSLRQTADGAWRLDVPNAETLAPAHAALGLPEDAPIPVDILLTFPNQSIHRAGVESFKVKKTVWIGEPSLNPTVPAILVDGAAITDEVVVPLDRDVYLEIAGAEPGLRVNWLTNVGDLFQDDNPRAFVHVLPAQARMGELVVVVRDDVGGVAWRVLPMRVE